MLKEFFLKRHGVTYTPTADRTTIGQGDGGPNKIQRFIPFFETIQNGFNEGNISGTGFVVQQVDKALLVGLGTIDYTKPSALGQPGVLAIPNWGAISKVCIYVKRGEDYDASNEFVLDIVDSSITSNNWDLVSSALFDLLIPTINVYDASLTLAPTGLSDINSYETGKNATWLGGTLSIRFSASNFKSKTANIIAIG